MSLYQTSVLKNYINLQEDAVIEKAYKKYVKYFLNPTIQENIRSSKEEEYQGIFLTELFVNILDYTLKPNPNFNLVAEYKNQTNSRKADGAILHNDTAIGVIELKGTKTKDLESIRKQAFDYKANQKGCVYVITSNFEKLRFYINDATEFEEFNLFELTKERFQLFYLCLQKDNIINNIPLQIKEASVVQEEKITKDFYKDYSLFKRELYRDLVKQNAKRLKTQNVISSAVEKSQEQLQLEKNVKLTLFKKSQKLIDRFLFIFFAEDRNLLPANSTLQILEDWNKLKELDAIVPLYDRFKLYFKYLDEGRAGTNKKAEIYAYNGGLFKPDAILNSLIIDDELLYKHTQKLANYDFASQVDVNILGHIFENSLNEIESVNAEIEGAEFDKQKSKRKKDGVFYTPKYITKYIVENTVGKLCTEKKRELGIKEEEYFKGRKNRRGDTIKKLVDLLDTYRDWLLQLTICDPACGSGAFLNQALNFLIAEHNYIDELKTKVLGGGLQFPDIENTILENNIFGVDLNEESVEIAKLSLWLRTAQPRRKLNDLSSNIKCGNSLIDSKTVAGDKAFSWENEFPKVFEKGGFDVVIGNPPYVIIFDEKIKNYLETNFEVFKRNNDLYTAFYKKGITVLKENGFIGFITPNSFIKGDYFKSLRNYLIKYSIKKIIDFNNTLVFEDANVFSAILILSKNNHPKDWLIYSDLDTIKGEIKKGNNLFIPVNPIQNKLKDFKKIEELFLVKDVGFNYWSIGRGKVRGNSVGSRVLYNGEKENIKDIPYIKGSNFNRFTKIKIENYLRYNYKTYLNENDIFRFSPDILNIKPKVIYRQTSSNLIATIDNQGFYCDKTVHVIVNKEDNNIDLYFLLGLFNSKLLNYLYKLLTEESGRAFAQVKTVNIKKIPFVSNQVLDLKIIELVKSNLNYGSSFIETVDKFQTYLKEKFQFEKLSKKLQNWHELAFGDFIKELNKAIKANNKLRAKQLAEGVISSEVEISPLTKKDEFEWLDLFEENKQKAQELQTQINQTDREIDAMVYELYGLTEEEIKIVEQS